MKVIKAPTGPKTKTFKCRCGATLEVEASDLKYQSDSRDGDAVSFTCPECKREEWVDASLLPQSIMKDVRR